MPDPWHSALKKRKWSVSVLKLGRFTGAVLALCAPCISLSLYVSPPCSCSLPPFFFSVHLSTFPPSPPHPQAVPDELAVNAIHVQSKVVAVDAAHLVGGNRHNNKNTQQHAKEHEANQKRQRWRRSAAGVCVGRVRKQRRVRKRGRRERIVSARHERGRNSMSAGAA